MRTLPVFLSKAAGAFVIGVGLAVLPSNSAHARDHYAAIAYSMTKHTAAASLSDWKTREDADNEAINRCNYAASTLDCEEVVYTSHGGHCLALVTNSTDYASASDKTKDGAIRKAFQRMGEVPNDPPKLKLTWCAHP